MADAEDRPHHLGHRARLRRRLLDKGATSLADHEILEAFLFGASNRTEFVSIVMGRDKMA